MLTVTDNATLPEVDEAIGNCRATLRRTADKDQREEVEDYLDALLDRRSELTKKDRR